MPVTPTQLKWLSNVGVTPCSLVTVTPAYIVTEDGSHLLIKSSDFTLTPWNIIPITNTPWS
jgi:hypothetical protein